MRWRRVRSKEVANAIFEHYLPRSAEDSLPASRPGQVIGLADRLDTLAGLFAAGLAPTGTKDPFAQRRAAITLVQSLGKLGVDFDLRQGLALAAEGLPVTASLDVLAACYEFITGRMRASLLEMPEGYRYDVVDAVLAAQAANPAGVFRAVRDSQRVGGAARLEYNPAGLCALCAHHPRSGRAVFNPF